MQINIKHIAFVILWCVCFVAGYSAYNFQSSPVSQFDGLWSGKTIIQYDNIELFTDIKLIVNDSGKEKGNLVVNFSPYDNSVEPFQTGSTAQIRIIQRKDKKLTFSLENVNYVNKERLENVIDRQLPTGGLLVSGSGWAIEPETIFVYITLSFGEEFGVVLNKID
ncbi:hypothetical protein [Vibrio astriarenae]|uniref:hypothetical protein n=1 Tax=Vibrio astriarenae TaxID=1481923 RepID=UPI003735F8BD